MTIKQELEIQKEKCGKMLGGKCKICKKTKSKKGMVVHHRWYITNDIVYKDFPQNDSGRLEYYKKLEPMIKRNPKRFSYLCTSCHHALSKIRMYGDTKFKALCLERKLTHPAKPKPFNSQLK